MTSLRPVRRAQLLALLAASGLLAACGYPFVYEWEPYTVPATPEHLVTQPITLVESPLAREALDCPVTAAYPIKYTPWVSFNDEASEYINIIEQDAQGRMWLATDGHGLSMYDGQMWHNWQSTTAGDGLPDAIRTMAVTDEMVYAGNYGSSVGGDVLTYAIERDEWGALNRNDMRGNVIGGLAANDLGQVYFIVDTGYGNFITTTVTTGETYTATTKPRLLLDIYSEGTWQYVTTPPIPDYQGVLIEDALFDQQGNYWVATGFPSGIWKYDGQTWVTYTADQGQLPSNNVQALATDSAGRVWAATNHGLAVYDTDGEWRVFAHEAYPWFSGWIKDVAVDAQDRVWLVTNEKLMIFNGKELAIFQPQVVHKHGWDNGIAFDAQGCVWIDTFDNLAVLRNQLTLGPGQYDFK